MYLGIMTSIYLAPLDGAQVKVYQFGAQIGQTVILAWQKNHHRNLHIVRKQLGY